MSTYVVRLSSNGLIYDLPAGEVLVSNGDGTFSGEQIFPVVPVYGAHLATTGPLPANTRAVDTLTANANGLLTLDGNAVTIGDVVLVKDEAAAEDDGLFRIVATGSPSAPFVLTRTGVPFVPGTLVVILRGTANGGKIAMLKTEGTIVLNVTDLDFQIVSGGGGGSFTVGGTPTPTYVVTANLSGAPVWASPVPFAVTSLVGTALYECGQSVVHPSFTVASTAPPTTALLTNTDNGESIDFHTTPTAVTSLQTYHKTTPNDAVTWTASEGNGIASASRAFTSVWGQRNYAGVVAVAANQATLIAAATYTALDTDPFFNFTLTDDGTHQGQFSIPHRFAGQYTVKDVDTGIGVGYTLLDTTNFTNIQGFMELYDHYKLDAGFNGTVNFEVVPV